MMHVLYIVFARIEDGGNEYYKCLKNLSEQKIPEEINV